VKTRDVLALALLAPALAAVAHQKPTLMAKPPKGAVILFDGKDASIWHQRGSNDACKWDIVDGCLVGKPGTGDIVTKRDFGDYRLHVEFWLPLMANESDQGRANSGVYQQGRYEIQVLDSYNNPTYKLGGCGAIYGIKDPDRNAIIPPEQWNTYDITFRAARFDKAGKQTANPRITVIHNGIEIHHDVELTEPATGGALDGLPPGRGPIILQDHGAPVRFRNIWIVPLDQRRQRG
jgi:hypothetical protein